MPDIRPAKLQDARTLMQVHRDAVFSKGSGFYELARLEAWSPGPTPDRVANIEKEIADPNYIVLISEHENEILGFAIAIPSKNELRALYVKPNSVGHIGQKLLNEIEKQSFAAGAEFLEFDASLNAEAFYKAHGYKEIGRANHVSSNGDVSAAVQMKKLRPRKRKLYR